MQKARVQMARTVGEEAKIAEGKKQVAELLRERWPNLQGEIVAARVAGELMDLSRLVPTDVAIEPITLDSPAGREILRHSTSHVMAQAVQELYPETKVAIGPAIEDGFYYDFDSPQTFGAEELAAIEERMRDIIARDLPFERQELTREERSPFSRNGGRTTRWNSSVICPRKLPT